MRVLPVTLVALLACSSSPAPETEGDASVAPEPDADGVIGEPGTHMARIGPFTAAPGFEDTVCVSVDLGNETAGYIRGIRVHLGQGSHHLIVHRVDEGAPDPEPQSCGAFAHASGGTPLFIAQQLESSLAYPEGAGMAIEAHQTIGLEMHYINYFGEGDVDVEAMVEFDVVPASEVLEEVQFLFTGDLGLTIPPRETSTVNSFHSLPAGARVFALTSHTHQLGQLAAIERTTGEFGEGPVLHESYNWSEPPLDVFDPPLVFEEGEGLKLTCEYLNPTDTTVHFGTGFDDEMCFLWAYYLDPR